MRLTYKQMEMLKDGLKKEHPSLAEQIETAFKVGVSPVIDSYIVDISQDEWNRLTKPEN